METLDDYEIIRGIGDGSFAQVYLAIDKKTGDNVAIKKVRCLVD